MESVRVWIYRIIQAVQVGLTVNNQNILSRKLEGHSVQLFADILAPGDASRIRYERYSVYPPPTSSVDQA